MLNPYKNTDQVNAVIKVRRGPEVDRSQVTYEDGELVYSTDKKRLFVGDGIGDEGTEGGNLVGNKLWVSDSFNSANLPYIEKYDMVYRPSTTGFYILTGNSIIDPNSYVLVGGKELIPQISTFTLPKATNSTLGGVIVKSGLSVDVNGNLNVDFDSNTLGLIGNKLTVIGGTGGGTGESIGNASYNAYGKIRVLENTGLLINSGNLSVSIDNRTIKLSTIGGVNKLYVDSSEIEITNLPKATTSSLGAIVVGDGLVINNGNGILSVKSATPTTIGGVKPGDALSANPLNSKLDVIVDNTTIIVNSQNQLGVNYPTANDKDVLTYDGNTNTWGASALSAISPNTTTTVGNASAGIFVNAVCFIPSSPGTGTWTAPDGCYTARVTVVGGGSHIFSGGRSHFNYPSGSTTVANQLFATGGDVSNFPRLAGGNAGWNGLNNKAIGGISGDGDMVADQPPTGGSGFGGSGGGGSFGINGFPANSTGGTNLSYAANILPNYYAAINQSSVLNVSGNYGPGSGAGCGAWCTAIVSVTPGQNYSYAVGDGGDGSSAYPGKGAHGMVVIEW